MISECYDLMSYDGEEATNISAKINSDVVQRALFTHIHICVNMS